MCNFGVSQSLIYYAHIPVLIISLLIGMYIYFADRKNPVNFNLFIFILFFCFWTVNDLLQWIITDPVENLFLARIAIIEFISLNFFLFAIFSFTKKKVAFGKKMLFFLVDIPLLVFMFTDYNAVLTDGAGCNIEFGYLYWYMYFFAIAYLAYIAYIMVKYYRKSGVNNMVKNQIKIIIGAFSFFVFWFIAVLIASWISVVYGYPFGDSLVLYTPFGMIIFLGLTAYAITKYHFLVVRNIAAQILIYTILILIGTQYLFVNSAVNAILVTFTLILSIIFSVMLVQFINLESRQKDELEAANAKLMKIDKMKSEFISMAAHQLRTPLTTMKGFISIMKKGVYGKIPPKLNEPVGYIETANERLIILVEDMLNVSQIEAGRMSFNLKEASMNELAEEIFHSFSVMAKEKNLELELEKGKRLPKITMDYGKIRETISNIVDNAIKYTEKGSVKIETRKKDDSIQVIITDTGIGIEKDGFDFLFDKFSRGKEAQQIKKNGVGLGLYLGKKIIEAHYGNIVAKSRGRGMGSVFTITLPISHK